MTTYTIDMNEGICKRCNKKEFIAPNGYCLGCTAKIIKEQGLK